MSPEELGKKLLAEVEEVSLDELLHSLQLADDTKSSHFGLSALDGLLQAITEARTLPTKPANTAPIIELMSLQPGGGKTHLLYHLIATAVLPRSVGGQEAAVIVLDTDNRFSVPRLAQQIGRFAATQKVDTVLQALRHVHIFRPQSLASAIATVNSLQSYLFNPTLHHSFDRSIAFIALDSASAFYWQDRSSTEDAAVLHNKAIQPNDYIQLAAALKNASRILNTPVIFATWYLGPTKRLSGFGAENRSFRPSLPPPWQNFATLRLVVKRADVRRLPVDISVEEALRESQQRQKVVELGRFECFINEWGMDERTLQKLQNGSMGFEFFVTEEGVRVDDGGP